MDHIYMNLNYIPFYFYKFTFYFHFKYHQFRSLIYFFGQKMIQIHHVFLVIYQLLFNYQYIQIISYFLHLNHNIFAKNLKVLDIYFRLYPFNFKYHYFYLFRIIIHFHFINNLFNHFSFKSNCTYHHILIYIFLFTKVLFY